MPEQLEGRTTDLATWMRTPANLDRFTAFKREADAGRRAIADRQQPGRVRPRRSVAPHAPA
ncbi:hypothetical protein [Streptomyces colonosanans]|uniref:hypothetical protein n=1 Tax=Streptomyces colonosanans TaxID=1428652 RepID=UPI0015A5D7A1|nr:hypothetical protein [Streptomyces colonosanans]